MSFSLYMYQLTTPDTLPSGYILVFNVEPKCYVCFLGFHSAKTRHQCDFKIWNSIFWNHLTYEIALRSMVTSYISFLIMLIYLFINLFYKHIFIDTSLLICHCESASNIDIVSGQLVYVTSVQILFFFFHDHWPVVFTGSHRICA